jgi:hypothetical protein
MRFETGSSGISKSISMIKTKIETRGKDLHLISNVSHLKSQ